MDVFLPHNRNSHSKSMLISAYFMRFWIKYGFVTPPDQGTIFLGFSFRLLESNLARYSNFSMTWSMMSQGCAKGSDLAGDLIGEGELDWLMDIWEKAVGRGGNRFWAWTVWPWSEIIARQDNCQSIEPWFIKRFSYLFRTVSTFLWRNRPLDPSISVKTVNGRPQSNHASWCALWAPQALTSCLAILVWTKDWIRSQTSEMSQVDLVPMSNREIG
jgi:hypothetical protein